MYLKSVNSNITLILLLVATFFFFHGCKDCPTIDNTKPPGDESDIIFTGKALNSDIPGIFGVKQDGSELDEIKENALIFAKSLGQNFVYLRKQNGTDQITKFSLTNPNKDTLLSYNGNVIEYPVRSPDGQYVAFFNGNDALVVNGNNGIWFEAIHDICPKTIPVFSPDSKYIAFYEGDSLSEPLKINIVSSDNPGNIINSRELVFGIIGMKGEAILDWSNQNIISYSYTKNSTLDVIGLWRWQSNSLDTIALLGNMGAFNPILSPDQNWIIFIARDGNVWLTNNVPDNQTRFWIPVTDVNENEYILYPQWSDDGTKILYTKFFKNNSDIYSGKLFVATETNPGNKDAWLSNVVCDNVNRGFWSKK